VNGDGHVGRPIYRPTTQPASGDRRPCAGDAEVFVSKGYTNTIG
jgi:hypothetical protein